MVTIELHNLLLHGFHGVHQEEKKVMNTFEVNLDVLYEEKNRDFQHLDDTISYTVLYGLVKEKFQQPVLLLEKLAQGVIESIRGKYPWVRKIGISIYKLQAPIENFQGKVGVSMTWESDDAIKT
jgi:dihydroneopterin aldolase